MATVMRNEWTVCLLGLLGSFLLAHAIEMARIKGYLYGALLLTALLLTHARYCFHHMDDVVLRILFWGATTICTTLVRCESETECLQDDAANAANAATLLLAAAHLPYVLVKPEHGSYGEGSGVKVFSFLVRCVAYLYGNIQLQQFIWGACVPFLLLRQWNDLRAIHYQVIKDKQGRVVTLTYIYVLYCVLDSHLTNDPDSAMFMKLAHIAYFIAYLVRKF